MKKIYCEPGALVKEVRQLGQLHGVGVVHSPYDSDSHTLKAGRVVRTYAANTD